MNMVFHRELDGREQAYAEVTCGERRQRLSVVSRNEETVLILTEGSVKMRSWPLHAVKLTADQPGGNITLEAGGETLTFNCSDESSRRELSRAAAAALAAESGRPLADEALEALLEDAASDDADAEQWVQRLADRVAKLDTLNVGGMLAAATEGGGAKLADRLEASVDAGSALSARLSRYDSVTRGAPGARQARSGAARADQSARALLLELDAIYKWLDPPALADLDALPQISLATPSGRVAALAACASVLGALQHEGGAPPAWRRLAAVRDRLRKLAKARDHLAASISRHLNNLLIHLGNEACSESSFGPRRYHRELLQYAPAMRCLKQMDEKAYSALTKVYVGSWSRVYEREIRTSCESARNALAVAPPEKVEDILDQVLTLIETICNSEQDFCTQFFHLDVDVKSEISDGERSEKSEGGESSKKVGSECRKLMAEMFPTLETELGAVVASVEKHDQFGAMRALSCVSRRVSARTGAVSVSGAGPGGGAGGGAAAGGGARTALAAAAVAAKRAADRAVQERVQAMSDNVKQASRKPKCGILPFISEFESLCDSCEAIFSSSDRRGDLDRWYATLADAMITHIQNADHPRTPRQIIHTENYHRLHGVLSMRRIASLEPYRRECRARYSEALRAYVAQYFGRPLEKLAQFFEGVAEAVAGGVREEEVCYRAAFSKQELRRVLAMYPPHEVRKSLHRLYRTVEKHVSEEGGLLQVVWRAMQEEFIAQHLALQARITACYPGAGLSLPLTTEDILAAFSDIAREH